MDNSNLTDWVKEVSPEKPNVINYYATQRPTAPRRYRASAGETSVVDDATQELAKPGFIATDTNDSNSSDDSGETSSEPTNTPNETNDSKKIETEDHVVYIDSAKNLNEFFNGIQLKTESKNGDPIVRVEFLLDKELDDRFISMIRIKPPEGYNFYKQPLADQGVYSIGILNGKMGFVIFKPEIKSVDIPNSDKIKERASKGDTSFLYIDMYLVHPDGTKESNTFEVYTKSQWAEKSNWILENKKK